MGGRDRRPVGMSQHQGRFCDPRLWRGPCAPYTEIAAGQGGWRIYHTAYNGGRRSEAREILDSEKSKRGRASSGCSQTSRRSRARNPPPFWPACKPAPAAGYSPTGPAGGAGAR
jgi:hypothetical protein